MFVQQQAQGDVRAEEERTGFVVVDERGEIFLRLRAAELPIALWRTTRAPVGLQLPEATVILFVTYAEPPWDAIRDCAQRYRTVVLAVHAHKEHHLVALRAGAFGYLDPAMSPDSLRRALLGALRGEPAFPREAMGTWMREARRVGQRGARGLRTPRLTARQTEIVGLIAGGATDKEIAVALGIRTATAQKHVANLLRRLGVANRAAAVGLLLKEGEALPQVPRADRRRR